jgi:hypothetical protein
MRKRRNLAALVAFTVLATACYHQVVRTGAPPGGTVIERPWTATYIFGLVPATAINTAAECPAGVAIVETQQTFLNGLVGLLTIGIYTPQTVRITCAAGGSGMQEARAIEVPAGASATERATAIREAIALAQRTGDTVVVYSAR